MVNSFFTSANFRYVGPNHRFSRYRPILTLGPISNVCCIQLPVA